MMLENIDENMREIISNLILYHDIGFDKLNDEEINKIIDILGKDGIKKLFQIKRSDLLSQNPKYHYELEKYDSQEDKILKLIK